MDRARASTSAIRKMLPIALIVLAALAVRLYLVTGPVDWVPVTTETEEAGYVQRGMKLSGDPGPVYDRLAQNFMEGRGLLNDAGQPMPTRAPLYPLTLAGFYSVFGRELVPVGIFHAILGALTCLLVYYAARTMSTESAALVAAGGAAIIPEFLKFTSRLWASTLLVFLTAAFVAAMVTAYRRKSAGWSVVAGVLLGLLALTRFELLILVPFVVLWQIADSRLPGRKRVALAAMLTAAFVITVTPWLVYNRATSVDGLARAGGGRLGGWLWGQFSPHARTVWEDPPVGPKGEERGLGAAERAEALAEIEARVGTDDRGALDPYMKRQAMHYMRDNPLRCLTLMTSRFMLLWNLWPTPPPSMLAFVAYWAFLALAVVGFVVNRHQPEMRLLLLIVIAVTLFYSFLHGHPRYRLPATIPVIIMASIGLVHLWKRARAETARVQPVADN